MELVVYDNLYTFNKHMPFNGNQLTRLQVSDIYITIRGAFWFRTEMKREIKVLDINKPYVHLHPGITNVNKMQFDKKPFHVTKWNFKYNPKTLCMEVKPSIFRKPVWEKRVKYYGSELPNRKVSALGTWYYDYSKEKITIILDYFPLGHGFKVHWENEEEPVSDLKLELLEERVENLQSELARRTSQTT